MEGKNKSDTLQAFTKQPDAVSSTGTQMSSRAIIQFAMDLSFMLIFFTDYHLSS